MSRISSRQSVEGFKPRGRMDSQLVNFAHHIPWLPNSPLWWPTPLECASLWIQTNPPFTYCCVLTEFFCNETSGAWASLCPKTRQRVFSVQFSSVTQSCSTLCDPMNHNTPGLPVHHQLPAFTQTHVHWVGDPIQPSHPLLSPSLPTVNLSQHRCFF